MCGGLFHTGPKIVQWAQWLNPSNQDMNVLRQMINSDDQVKFHPVSFAVSSVGKNRQDNPNLIEPKSD